MSIQSQQAMCWRCNKIFNVGEDHSCSSDKKKQLWEKVKDLEDVHCPKAIDELSQIRATMLVNFGPNGRQGQFINDRYSTLAMVIEVLTILVEKTKGPSHEE